MILSNAFGAENSMLFFDTGTFIFGGMVVPTPLFGNLLSVDLLSFLSLFKSSSNYNNNIRIIPLNLLLQNQLL